MDYLRSCYFSNMLLYSDRPSLLIPGKWRWCAPDAKPLRWPHIYSSSIWDESPETPDPPFGEQRPRGAWYNGAGPTFPGFHVCGDPEDWNQPALFATAGSVPWTSQGIPICCFGVDLVSNLRVDQVNGEPVTEAADWLSFNENDGLRITIENGGHVTINQDAASVSQKGAVTTGNQQFAGGKVFTQRTLFFSGAASEQIGLCVDGSSLIPRTTMACVESGTNAIFALRLKRSESFDQWGQIILDGGEDVGFPTFTIQYGGADTGDNIPPRIQMIDSRGNAFIGQTGTVGAGATVVGGVVVSLGSAPPSTWTGSVGV